MVACYRYLLLVSRQLSVGAAGMGGTSCVGNQVVLFLPFLMINARVVSRENQKVCHEVYLLTWTVGVA